jgi:hypothetical protein
MKDGVKYLHGIHFSQLTLAEDQIKNVCLATPY